MPRHIWKSPAISLFFASGVILILAVCLQYDISKLATTSQEREAIRKARFHATQLTTHLADAESGQRGFLLTGEEVYLTPYYEAIQGIEALLVKMKTETIATRNSKEWQTVVQLINKRLFLLGETLKQRRSTGNNPSLRVVPSAEGRLLMVEIRERLETLQEREREILVATLARYDYEIQRLSVLLAMQGIIVLILAYLGIHHRRKHKVNAATALPSNVIPTTALQAKRAARK